MRTILLALVAAMMFPALIHARTLQVWPDGHGVYPNIQVAVDHAGAGDTVLLADGTYRGTGNRDIDFLGRNLVLRSQSGNAPACVLDCGASFGDAHRALIFHTGETPAARVEAITFRHGYEYNTNISAGYGGAAFCWTASPTFSQCVFEDNTAQGGAGVYVYQCSVEIDDCIFRGNTSTLVGGGAGVQSGQLVLQRCLLTGNTAQAGGAIDFDLDSSGSVLDCTLSGNQAAMWGGGIADYSSSSWIFYSIVSGNCAGQQGNDMWLYLRSSTTIGCCCISPVNIYGGNVTWNGPSVDADPLFCRPLACAQAPATGGDYTLSADSPCLPPVSPCDRLIGDLGQGCGVSGVAGGRVADGSGRSLLDLRAVNPIRSGISGYVSQTAPGRASFSLLDAAGRLVEGPFLRDLPAGESRFDYGVDRFLPNGWYLLVLEESGQRTVRPVLRVR